MNELQMISKEIENLRQVMYQSIEIKQYIISSESLILSEHLDSLIVKYELMKKI